MKHRKQSVVEVAQFRSLDGQEMAQITVEKICADFKVELLRSLNGTNNFLAGDSYPAVAVDGQLKVNVLPNNKDPLPFYVNVHFILGTTIEAAPDKLREDHGLEVLQPQKRASGFIMNAPVVKETPEATGNPVSEGEQ